MKPTIFKLNKTEENQLEETYEEAASIVIQEYAERGIISGTDDVIKSSEELDFIFNTDLYKKDIDTVMFKLLLRDLRE